uniref:SSD domain-containing protein n=1 Tax=Angiostrongylus costaricensis TaxID=334426 RepID=A0A158PE29_ANGCS
LFISFFLFPGTKTNELLVVLKSISLKGFFRLWGTFIGQFPIAFLISGLILCSLSCGIINLHLRDNVRDGYTPRTSRSRQETNLYREFLGSEGDPAMTTVLMLAKDNGSMHRLNYLQEAVQTMVYISKNLSTTVSGGSTVGYGNFCGHYCDSNVVVGYFLQALYQKTLDPGSMSLQLTYPIADLRGIKLHLERNFFGVQTTDNYNITNIEYIKVISMSFMAEMKTAADTERLGAWELELFDYCSKYTSAHSNMLEVLVIGAEIVDTEMNKDGQRMSPYFATGVNDSFLTVHAWLRQPLRLSAATRLGKVLEEVGPSITTTTLTNVVTFLIGWLTPTEEISIFCFGSAMALGFAYIYTVIIFCPILYYCSPKETKDAHEGCFRRKGKRFFRGVLLGYSRVLSDHRIALLLFIGTLVYWYFGIMGTISITAKLDTEKILPKDTPIHRPNRIIENIVWAEYYPVTVIVNNPVDVRDVDRLNYVKAFVNEFEQLPTCRGSNFTIFWLRDYVDYYWGVGVNDFDFYFDADEYPDEKEFGYKKLAVVYENNTSWDDRIDLMLKWRAIVDRYPNLNASVWNVNSMFVDQMLSLKSLTWQTCLWTLLCMTIVCTIFIQNPVSVLIATMAIASISLGVMGKTQFSFRTVSFRTALFRYLSFWHLDLDPVSLCAVLISIGMAVDFVAHTTYHYQLSYREVIRDGQIVRIDLDTQYARLRHTISNIAWPMSQAGISTVICILPIVVLQNYIPLVFVKTITLVVIWGLWHGLVLLPAFLSQIPLYLLNFNCYRLLVSGRTDSTLQEMSLLAPEASMRI